VYRDHTVSVVVPAYNEEGFVGGVLETIPSYVDRIYVVDDCSTDGTWDEINRYAARENRETRTGRDRGVLGVDGGVAFDHRISMIRHPTNRGVGAAIKTGYRRALADGIDVTAVMAGDGQMDPDQLPRLLDPIVEREADYAKGNRLVNGAYREGMPRFRLVGNAILTALTNVASGYWRIVDPQNGYTAISARALERIDVASIYDDYGYPNDLLVRLNAVGLRVADVAMPARYGDEESTIDYVSYVPTVSALLVRSFVWRLTTRYSVGDAHPVPLFYAASALATSGGVLGGVGALYRHAHRPDDGRRDGRGLVEAAVSALLLAAGCAFLALAVSFELRANEGLEVQRYE
jgi:glycosyltransferase involved in cell wall biosynthesis